MTEEEKKAKLLKAWIYDLPEDKEYDFLSEFTTLVEKYNATTVAFIRDEVEDEQI